MPQNSLEFSRVCLTRVTQVDFRMFAVWSNTVTIPVLERKSSHTFNSGRFSGIWTHMHDLHTQAFLEVCQPQLRPCRPISLLLFDFCQAHGKNIVGYYSGLQNHECIKPIV